MNEAGGDELLLVPILVPEPGSPTVTQGNPPGHEFTPKRSVALPSVTLDREICSLKIRVSGVRFRPWPPTQISKLGGTANRDDGRARPENRALILNYPLI